jgi:2-polyprenyl-3-methyl-5-hydroxy-6-metoxy-1,4-benzoquinol methylase
MMVDRVHGKPIDIAKFKKPVLDDIGGHLVKIRNIVEYLASHEVPIDQAQCYVCGGQNRQPLTEIHGFSYVTCSACGHVYTSRRYSDDAIRRFYENNAYWAEVTYANKETCYYRRDNVALPKVEFGERYLDDKSGIWIDVGSGIGDLVSVAQTRGYQAVGLELSTTSVDFAREVFDLELVRRTIAEYLADHPEVIGKASVVSMIGVLEHVVSPIELLADAHRTLRAGGIAMIQVPNARSLASMVQACFPENVFRHMSPIEHIMLFTESSLATALKRTGFEPMAYWYHGLDIYELMTTLVLANNRVQDSMLYRTLLEDMNSLQQVIDDREQSDRIICIAKKTGAQ